MAKNGKTGADYFRSDDDFIYLTAPYCEFYIPMDYFKSAGGFAEDRGQIIHVIGIFEIGLFDENNKLIERRTMAIPAYMDVFNYEFENRNVVLSHSTESVPCKVLSFYKGSKVMNSETVEDSSNVLSYLGLICGGKLPPSIPYSKSPELWRKNQKMNGVGLGVPAVIEELILSAAYRNKEDMTQKYAVVAGQNNSTVGEFDYKMATIRQICQYTSTFNALWFEDFDSMVTTSLNRTREKKPEIESPLEEIIKM